MLHVHLEHAAVQGAGQAAGGLARVQETGGPVTAEQVRLWCGQPDTQITVQPVLDLADHLHVNSYQASARLKLQTQLRDNTCVFAYCYRPAEACDCEHRVAAGWSYITIEPGVYLRRSPLGYQFLRDHTGTIDVTPDEDRRRLAHELRAHFSP